MYTAFYNLTSKPFQISSDPAFIWLGEKHKEALATLKYGILDNKGFMLLTGDVGTGKTTLINTLINSLDDDILYASVPDPRLSLNDFLNYIAQTFNIEGEFESKGKFLSHFRRFLEDAYGSKKKVLLLIDESQLLTQDLLEEIRLLSNIQKDGTNLLNIFFVGQDEFNEILSRTENRAVAQRLTLNYHLGPLTEKETRTYILHRLKIAGAKESLFNRAAMAEIHTYSGGFPRRINIICDHCLLTGFVQEKDVIDAALVQTSAHDLKIPQYIKKSPPPPAAPPPPEPAADTDLELAKLVVQARGQGYAAQAPSQAAKSRPMGPVLIFFMLLAGAVLFFTVPREKLISTLGQLTGGQVSAEKVTGSEAAGDTGAVSGDKARDITAKKDSSVVVQELAIEQGNSAVQQRPESVEEPLEETGAEPLPEVLQESMAPEASSPPVAAPPADTAGKIESVPAEKEDPSPAGQEAAENRSLPEPVMAAPQKEVVSSPPPVVSMAGVDTDQAQTKEAFSFPGRKVMVRFERDSSDFYFTDLEHVNDFVKAINSHPDAVLVISGHTDSLGSETYNHRLSLFRANMIRSFFLGRGVRPYQLKVQGFGSTRPLASNETAEGRTMNRRVEIDVLK